MLLAMEELGALREELDRGARSDGDLLMTVKLVDGDCS
jgi:hypothetical protein